MIKIMELLRLVTDFGDHKGWITYLLDKLTACFTGLATNPYIGFFRHAFRSSESRVVAIPDILNPKMLDQ